MPARPTTEPGPGYSPRETGFASSGSRRRSFAAAAGTRIPRSPRRVPASATSTAPRAPPGRHTSAQARRGRRCLLPPASGSRPDERCARSRQPTRSARLRAPSCRRGPCPTSSMCTSTTPTSSIGADGWRSRLFSVFSADAPSRRISKPSRPVWAKQRQRSRGPTWLGSKLQTWQRPLRRRSPRARRRLRRRPGATSGPRASISSRAARS